MRRGLSIALVALAVCGVFARTSYQRPAPSGEGKKIVDVKSDLSGPVAPGDSAVFFVGNFAAQHNGTVITCDSAVRYSDMHLEFFGNVLINKNTTYIYGDRAEYDGEANEARIYSDIVKVVDGDATLYTYEFLFNTLDNVGQYGGGGVLTNRDSRLETQRGYYYGDTKELVGVDQVQMRNEEYELTGDSVVYDMATDNAYFFDRTNIWSRDGDYLYADRGAYRKADSLYRVTRNGYVLTEKQEVWSDSIDFYRAQDHVILRHDFQIDDTEHKILAFGDYGEYWKTPGNALLTRDPAVVSYDLSQGDSLFMRADSIFLNTIFRADEEAAAREVARADSLARLAVEALLAESSEPAGTSEEEPAGAVSGGDSVVRETSVRNEIAEESEPSDDEEATEEADGVSGADSLSGADSVQLSAEELKARQREAEARARAARKAAAAAAQKAKLEEIAARRKARNIAKLEA
ncbi:MAG: hypothetical protein K2I59_03470, partial [Alistipes sp.]|nr:hypothetical protein [Alistipes sp.]